MQEENREGISGALKTLAAVVIVFLLLAALYVGYQAMQVLFPPNTYETALLATVEDTVDAEGVLLFEESYVAGAARWGIWWQTASVFRQAQRWLRSTAMQRRPPCASS